MRGSCFKHTAFTELRMNQLVQDVLQQQGLDCANRTPGNNKHWEFESGEIFAKKIFECLAVKKPDTKTETRNKHCH